MLLTGFLFYVLTNYTALLQNLVDGFLYAGTRATAANRISLATLQDPDRIIRRGLELMAPAKDKIFAEWSTGLFGSPSVDVILLLFVLIVSFICFAVMAIQVFVTYLEYLVISAAGFILLPFGVFKPTAFIAERVFGALIGFGVKLMVLAVIIGATDQFLATMSLPGEVTWQQAFEFLSISLALAFLSFQAPATALSLLSGSPNLSLASVVGAAGAGAALGSGAAQTTAGVAKAGATALGLAVGGGAGAIRAGSTATTKLGQTGQKAENAVRAAAGAALGPVSGGLANTSERILYGKSGGPEGRDASLARNGYSPEQGGIVGAFNRGKFAVPQYRRYRNEQTATRKDKGES